VLHLLLQKYDIMFTPY